MVTRIALGCLPCLVVLGLCATAHAQDTDSTDERARLHFESGAAYYDAGEYESALRDFERAYELSERPGLFYNMYLCAQALGQLETAAEHLARYLNEVEDVPNRETLERRLEALRERIARRQETGETEDTPPPETVETPDPEPVDPLPPPADEGGANVPAIAAFATAGVGVVGAAIFGALTLSEDSSLADSACGRAMTCTEDDTSTLGTFALLTDISLGIAVAGAVTGTLLLVLDGGGSDAEQARVSVTPVAGPGLLGLAARGAL